VDVLAVFDHYIIFDWLLNSLNFLLQNRCLYFAAKVRKFRGFNW
jgi:hypothetical protein